MKHVLIDARESGTTTGRYVDKLVEYLHNLNIVDLKFTILTHEHRLEHFKSVAPSFSVESTKYKHFTLGEQIGLKRQIINICPDLVHFAIVQQPLLYGGRTVTSMLDLTTLRFKNPSRNSVVFWVKQKVYYFVNLYVARKSEAIITISDYVKNDIIDFAHIKEDKITTTYNSADYIKEPAEEIESLTGEKFICYVGRHLPHKNLPRLIEAHKILLEKHPNLKLAIVGKTDDNATLLMNNVEDEQKKNIIFTGFISEGQLKWLYQNTACYVFPSLSEGFGLPSLEAMVHGAPVASSNATCLPEINGDGVVYFDPLNVEEMSRVIASVIDDKKLSHELIARGKKQASKFSWERMAQQTLEVYRKALK